MQVVHPRVTIFSAAMFLVRDGVGDEVPFGCVQRGDRRVYLTRERRSPTIAVREVRAGPRHPCATMLYRRGTGAGRGRSSRKSMFNVDKDQGAGLALRTHFGGGDPRLAARDDQPNLDARAFSRRQWTASLDRRRLRVGPHRDAAIRSSRRRRSRRRSSHRRPGAQRGDHGSGGSWRLVQGRDCARRHRGRDPHRRQLDRRTAEIARARGARVLKTPRRGLGRAYIDALPYIRGRYVADGRRDCTYDFRRARLRRPGSARGPSSSWVRASPARSSLEPCRRSTGTSAHR